MSLKEFKAIIDTIFMHVDTFKSVERGKKFSFQVDTDFEDVTFDKLRQLSEALDTTLINLTGGDNCYCETCGPMPYCEITVELRNDTV